MKNKLWQITHESFLCILCLFLYIILTCFIAGVADLSRTKFTFIIGFEFGYVVMLWLFCFFEVMEGKHVKKEA